ncbi:MAG: carbonic anhydrase [Kofleriaceae bacterium]
MSTPRRPRPADALERLRAGNARFVADVRADDIAGRVRRAELIAGQHPFAIVLGCSDSRVPAEIVFDQGLGDLFVIRVAGNVVAPSQLGSVEFAVERFGTPLVVVMGHTRCGAIEATVDACRGRGQAASRNVSAIVERVRPAIAPLVEASPRASRSQLIATGGRANVRASVNQVRHGSAHLEALEARGEVLVVGAEYDLESGAVDFFDAPATSRKRPSRRAPARR